VTTAVGCTAAPGGGRGTSTSDAGGNTPMPGADSGDATLDGWLPGTPCGDGVCGSSETCATCTSDCGACPGGAPDCAACENGGGCASNRCVSYGAFPEIGGFCGPSQPCGSTSACPTGWTCGPKGACQATTTNLCSGGASVVKDNCGHVLVTTSCPVGQSCGGGGVCSASTGKSANCAPCSDGAECASGRCEGYAAHPEVGQFCAPSQACSSNSQCPAGWLCTSSGACGVTVTNECNGPSSSVSRDNCGHVLSTTPCTNGAECTGAGVCAAPAGGEPICTPCSADAECESGYCGTYNGHSFCQPLKQCVTDADCPFGGWQCAVSWCIPTKTEQCNGDSVVLVDNCGNVAEGWPCPAGSVCVDAGVCTTESGGQPNCAPCSANADCLSGHCNTVTPKVGSYCTPLQKCTTDAGCPSGGWTCSEWCLPKWTTQCKNNAIVKSNNCGHVLSTVPCVNGSTCVGDGVCSGFGIGCSSDADCPGDCQGSGPICCPTCKNSGGTKYCGMECF
jgi:hypothetical protein